MSTIDKLGIIGIRSYDPNHLEFIEFFKPLTIIWGHNGSGKTTIIECLKLITSGAYPPNSQNGKTFIMDPKLNGRPEVKSQIKLKFKALNKKQIIAMRTFQITALKSAKLEFKTLEQILKTKDANGDIVSINHSCAEIEKQVPELLGVSRAVLENVIFCHQEDSLWPFGDTATLKEIFDELFDTTMYTKMHETIRGIHKSIAKDNKELATKLVFFKKDFDIHVSRKNKVLKDAENLNEDIKKIEESEKVIKLWEDKKKDFDNLEQEIKDAEIDLNLIRYKRENHHKDLHTLRSSLSKEFEADSIEGLQKCKEILQKKYRDFENEIKDKRYRLDTQKGLAEMKRRELEDLQKAEQNDTNLVNEMKKSRDELSSVLKQQQFSYETEETFNERLANLGDTSLQNAEREAQEVLGTFEQEEQKYVSELEQKTQEISDLRNDIERLEQEFRQKKEKFEELIKLIDEFQTKANKKAEYEQNIREIESGLKDYGVDLELTNEELTQLAERQNVMTSKIKRLNELRKVQAAKSQFDETEGKIAGLTESYKEYRQKFIDGVKTTGLTVKNMENLEELSILVGKTLEATKKDTKRSEEKKRGVEEKLRDIQAFRNVINKEISDLEKKIKNIEKSFQKVGLSTLVKSNQEILDFEAQYKEIKKELANAEKALTIMDFTQNDLQGFLLGKSKEKGKCEFCEKSLSKADLEKLEKTIVEFRKTKAEQHQETLREKIIGFRKEKEVLKKRKVDYEEFSRLKRRSNELQQNIAEKEGEKQNLDKELDVLGSSLEKMKSLSEKCEDLIESYGKMEALDIERDEKEKLLSDLEKEHPGVNNIKLTNEEREMLTNSKIYEELDEVLAEMKKKEKRKARLMSEFQQYTGQKDKMIEFLGKLEGEEGKVKGLEIESKKLKESMDAIREDLPRKIARIKKLDNEKKSTEELLKTVKKQAKLSEKEISRKKTLIEFLLPQFKQKMELIKVINRKKSNRKEEDELKSLKEKLKKDLTIMTDVIKEYETFIEEKKNLINEKEQHFQLIDANIKLKEMEIEIQGFEEEAKKKTEFLNNKRLEIDQLNVIKAKIEEEKLKYNALKERTKMCLDNLDKENNELKLKASQTEETYIESLINHEIQNGILADLETYVKTLEQTLLRYHRTKMEEINKIIADTWRDVYDGEDIIKIEIKSDEEISTAKKSKNYNYRIVYYTKQNKELDMKGRCSMGQKVLASIVIRLALAEAFGVNCAILALDEPTTNLDIGNVRKLAQNLGNLIEARKQNENFQLIIITHDKEFVKMLSEYADKYYEIAKNETGASTITIKNIDV